MSASETMNLQAQNDTLDFYLYTKTSATKYDQTPAIAEFYPGLLIIRNRKTQEEIKRIALLPGIRVKGGYSAAKLIDTHGERHVFSFYDGTPNIISAWDLLFEWVTILDYWNDIKKFKKYVRNSIATDAMQSNDSQNSDFPTQPPQEPQPTQPRSPQPVATAPPAPATSVTPPKSNLALVITLVIVGLVLLAAAVAGLAAVSKRNTNSTSSSDRGMNMATSSTTTEVTTSCYTYDVPSGYVGVTTTKSCDSGVNTSRTADDLTAVAVKPLKTIVNGDIVSYLRQTLQSGGATVMSVTGLEVDRQSAAKAVIKGTDAYPNTVYVLVTAPQGGATWSQNGIPINSYSFKIYEGTATDQALETVLDSVRFKSPSVDGTSVE